MKLTLTRFGMYGKECSIGNVNPVTINGNNEYPMTPRHCEYVTLNENYWRSKLP